MNRGSGLIPERIVDPPHDSVRPLNRGGDYRFRPGTGPGIEQIVSRLQVPGNEDPRDNRQHAFAAFVHSDILSVSPFVRLQFLHIAPTRPCV